MMKTNNVFSQMYLIDVKQDILFAVIRMQSIAVQSLV